MYLKTNNQFISALIKREHGVSVLTTDNRAMALHLSDEESRATRDWLQKHISGIDISIVEK